MIAAMNVEQRIRHDARRLAGDRQAMALLECLAKHLFDSRLDATFLGKASGAPRQVRDRLAAEVGPLKAYITELRMTEAARLVRETDLPMNQIAGQLGYEVLRTFRRAFKEVHRVTPAEMRQQAESEPAPTPDPAAAVRGAIDACSERLTPRARARQLERRANLGLLDDGSIGDLRARLRRRHPEIEEALAAGEPMHGVSISGEATPTEEPPRAMLGPVILRPTGDYLEPYAASAVFDRILALPVADLRHAMLDGVRMGSPASFKILEELCTEHTRWNPDRAVAVAELGVQLLELQRQDMGEHFESRKAAAWAFLGRLQMLVGDFAATERSIRFAWEEAEAPPPWAEIEIRRVESMLRSRQGRGSEATATLDRAVELSRGLPADNPARAQSLSERLELAAFLGEAELVPKLCDELEALAERGAAGLERVHHWRGLIAYHRGKAYAAIGRDDLAEKLWRQAGEHVAADQAATEPPGAAVFETAVLSGFLTHELARLGGRLGNLEVYEILLRRTIDRYRLARIPIFEIAALAELAAVCALRGRITEARALASSAADFLDDLPSHRRAWNAAARLRTLAAGGTDADVSVADVLVKLCVDLDSVRWEITGAQATEAAVAWRAKG